MALTDEQVQHFEDHGYVIVPEVVGEDDLAPMIAAIEAEIDRRARALHADGKITELHENAPFERRMALLHAQHPGIIDGMDIHQLMLPEVVEFMQNDRLLDNVASLVGPKITMNPIQHLRAKVPQRETVTGLAQNVPWHQDVGVMWEEADPVNIVTCWMPLIDATEQTGCMAIMPDVHKRGYLDHVVMDVGGSGIEPKLIEDDDYIVAECPRGGAVFMSKYTPHCGLPNVSDRVRWTLDLRYQPKGEPTGRPFHPAFVVQDPDNPQDAEIDFDDWRQRWQNAFKNAGGVQAHRTAPKEQRVWPHGQV